MPISSTLLAAGVQQQPPLLDVDWTLLVQLGLFLLLFAVLRLLVFGPYLRMRREQSTRIEGSRDEARRLDERIEQLTTAYEERLFSARRAVLADAAKLRATAEESAQARLAQVRRDANDRIEIARADLAVRVPAAALALRLRADRLARIMAAKALGRPL